MTPEMEGKLTQLRENIRGYDSLLVAYSGGVDSALVAFIAMQELGARSMACIGQSASFSAREMKAALELAAQLGIECGVVKTEEARDPRYTVNAGDRCYFCKTELFQRLTMLAADGGWNRVADGVHLGDIEDHRHGIRAAREAAVCSPLLEAGLNKADVRAIARELGISAWDKPAMACLSSRVPRGTAITPALLQQIEAAENAVADLGFREFRLRHHGEIARLELPKEDFARILSHSKELLIAIRVAGYSFVTLDLAGFRAAAADSVPLPTFVELTIANHPGTAGGLSQAVATPPLQSPAPT